jgi:hypothetical protein
MAKKMVFEAFSAYHEFNEMNCAERILPVSRTTACFNLLPLGGGSGMHPVAL